VFSRDVLKRGKYDLSRCVCGHANMAAQYG
jgi:hypothetical protein